MVHGIDIFYWGLSLLFCLAFGFAILLWARGWRREERAETARRMSELATEVAKLAAAVEQLEHTAASLRTADELLAQGIKDLQSTAAGAAPAPAVGRTVDPAPPSPPTPSPTQPIAEKEAGPLPEEDRFAEARRLLMEGLSPTEVAQKLDIGAAEAKMLARVVQRDQQAGDAG
jgi:hypothetical protein